MQLHVFSIVGPFPVFGREDGPGDTCRSARFVPREEATVFTFTVPETRRLIFPCLGRFAYWELFEHHENVVSERHQRKPKILPTNSNKKRDFINGKTRLDSLQKSSLTRTMKFSHCLFPRLLPSRFSSTLIHATPLNWVKLYIFGGSQNRPLTW